MSVACSELWGIRERWPGILLVIFAAILSYSPLLYGGGWFSDDYMFVFGQPGGTWPSLSESIRKSGAGSYSVARPFSLIIIGYGGWILGEFGAMCVGILGHAVNGVLLLIFLHRMRFPAAVALGATLLFVTAPWHTQTVVWWVCVHQRLSMAFFLLALISFQEWMQIGHIRYLIYAQTLVFASLLIYEQALASWIVFFAIALLHSKSKDKITRGEWRAGIWAALKLSGWMLLPYMIWVGAYLVTYPLDSGARTPGGGIERKFIALISVHLRWLHSLWLIPWRDLLNQGIDSITLPIWGLIGIFALSGGAILLKSDKAEGGIRKISILWILLFSYVLFAGFRGTFIAQGAISTQTRLNYGADMGITLGIVAIAYLWMIRHLNRPILYSILIILFCLFNIISTRGEAWHTSRNVQEEQVVFDLALAKLARNPEALSLVVIVRKKLTNGEVDFYEEKNAGWLKYRLEQVLRKSINVSIVRDGRIKDDDDSIVVELR